MTDFINTPDPGITDAGAAAFLAPQAAQPVPVPTPRGDSGATLGSLVLAAQSPGNYQKAHQTVLNAAVVKPPPPDAYRGLRTGPELSIEYEPNQAMQVELSNSLLRTLSPFVIQVEPPMIFGAVGGFPKAGTGISVTTYGSARRGVFEAARSNIGESAIATLDYRAGSVEQYVAMQSQASSMTPSAATQDLNSKARMGIPAIADVYAAVDIAMQLSAVVNTPPLVLLINPQTMTMDRNKIQQYQDRSRFGYIFHAWGEDQPKLSISARCGAFVSGGRGVQFASRRDSLAWQNLMNAFHFYRNNGYIYDTVGKSNAHHHVGVLSIRYDQWVYYGQIGSLSYSLEEGNQLGGIIFEMEFVVSMAVDTAQASMVVTPMKSPIPSLSDPRYAGMENRPKNKPGEFSIGLNSDGTPRLSTQGRVVGVGDAFSSVVGKSAQEFHIDLPAESQTKMGTTAGMPDQPIGTKGFVSFDVPTPGQNAVNQSNPDFVQPFQR